MIIRPYFMITLISKAGVLMQLLMWMEDQLLAPLAVRGTQEFQVFLVCPT
jgi:hypothetical protein